MIWSTPIYSKLLTFFLINSIEKSISYNLIYKLSFTCDTVHLTSLSEGFKIQFILFFEKV